MKLDRLLQILQTHRKEMGNVEVRLIVPELCVWVSGVDFGYYGGPDADRIPYVEICGWEPIVK